jgi:hypothetical protein
MFSCIDQGRTERIVWSVVRIRARFGSAGGSGMVSGEDTCTSWKCVREWHGQW